MERILSDEEKLRRAIEISQRRNNSNYRAATTTRVNVKEKKDYKLFQKMILQIIISLLIYLIFYLISSTNYVFSADFIKNTNSILNYDINFQELYNNLMVYITPKTIENQNIKHYYKLKQKYEKLKILTIMTLLIFISGIILGIIFW